MYFYIFLCWHSYMGWRRIYQRLHGDRSHLRVWAGVVSGPFGVCCQSHPGSVLPNLSVVVFQSLCLSGPFGVCYQFQSVCQAPLGFAISSSLSARPLWGLLSVSSWVSITKPVCCRVPVSLSVGLPASLSVCLSAFPFTSTFTCLSVRACARLSVDCLSQCLHNSCLSL